MVKSFLDLGDNLDNLELYTFQIKLRGLFFVAR